MFTEKTNQGWEIISTIKLPGGTHIVFKRRENNFGWGSYYNEEMGSWAQGHYDYEDPNEALQDLIEFALGKTLIPEGEKSFKGEIEAFSKQLAMDDLTYERYPIDDENEFLDEFYQKYYQEINEGFEIYQEERERLVDID